MRIAVAGMGYVGMSNAVMMARSQYVMAYDINAQRIDDINNRKMYLSNKGLENAFAHELLNLKGTCDPEEAFTGADYVIVATSTPYDDMLSTFDTSATRECIDYARKYAPEATIVVKSTVPIGFTESECVRTGYDKILFAPEFCRQDFALEDVERPARVVVGGREDALWEATKFANLMARCSRKLEVKIVLMGTREAEAVRLFSNAYLATRVAFFNELDTFAEETGLVTNDIIEGVCSDPRIGGFYNNPSFGYGGLRLPKDTLQLSVAAQTVPNVLLESVVRSNRVRKRYITREILAKEPKCVGVYRLTMKKDSDNCLGAAAVDIVRNLVRRGVEVKIYEPLIEEDEFMGATIVDSLDEIKNDCDIIICNRWNNELSDVQDKVYTRDNFMRD